MTNTIVEQYYNQICAEWGVVPTSDEYSGYESVESQLLSFRKEDWEKLNDQDKQKFEDDIFNIYRSVNVIPIKYFSLEGCKKELIDISNKTHSVKDKKISVGNTAGQNFSRFWFPNMQEAYTRKDKMVSMRSRFYDDTRLKRAIKFCYKYRDEGEKSVMPQNIRRALDLVSGGTIANFKPMNARAVYEYICPNLFGNVLDFSSGYGGRMIGSMTSNMRYNYTGIDPNTKTYNGLVALGELMTDLRLGSGYSMNHMPSEQFVPEDGRYDAAFSSPPYFNLETYTDEDTQCMNSCSTIDDWFDNYVEPTVKMLHKALDNEGLYAVNIADYRIDKTEFKIVEKWKEISEKIGFRYVERIDMILNVRPGHGNNKKTNSYKSEGIYIFQK